MNENDVPEAISNIYKQLAWLTEQVQVLQEALKFGNARNLESAAHAEALRKVCSEQLSKLTGVKAVIIEAEFCRAIKEEREKLILHVGDTMPQIAEELQRELAEDENQQTDEKP